MMGRGFDTVDYSKEALKMHREHHGKIRVECKVPLETRDDLSIAYTPGVAAPCKAIEENPALSYDYTDRGNLVAVITDGTAVLGLGNIGPLAAMPVMEGKAALFKRFAGVDAFPICLDTTDPEEIIRTVKILAPSFGGINLEDIASPKCFEIERRLEKELPIPVFHDDQHGTATVVAAGLLNALKLVKKELSAVKIVVNGPGAAGTAIIKMLHQMGAGSILACDRKGILYQGRPELTPQKEYLAKLTNLEMKKGELSQALQGADVFIGVSVEGALTPEMIEAMAPEPIVFAMANPVPEITYDAAVAAGVAVMGTGRSDFPNQINNVLAFPGIFKGALSVRARNITPAMKMAAAKAIAESVPSGELCPEYIVPDVFHPHVTDAVSAAVAKAWLDETSL